MTPQSIKPGDCLILPFQGHTVITAHHQPELRLPGEVVPQRRTWQALAAVFFALALWLKPTPTQAIVTSPEIVAATNDTRRAQGLSALQHDERLDRAATMKADDMFAQQYFDHRSPSGIRGWHWMSDAGYAYTEAGENLAKDFSFSQDVVTAWMGSDGHRQNMISPKFTDIGVAVVSGTYSGKSTTMIVMLFGRQTSVTATMSSLPEQVKTVAIPVDKPSIQPVIPPEQTYVQVMLPSLVEPGGVPVPDLIFTRVEPSPKYSLTLQPGVLGAETASLAAQDIANQTSAIATVIFSGLIIMAGFLSLFASWRISIYPQGKNELLLAQV